MCAKGKDGAIQSLEKKENSEKWYPVVTAPALSELTLSSDKVPGKSLTAKIFFTSPLAETLVSEVAAPELAATLAAAAAGGGRGLVLTQPEVRAQVGVEEMASAVASACFPRISGAAATSFLTVGSGLLVAFTGLPEGT